MTGGGVLNNSLSGDDISESTLGKVPSAAAADSAATAGGADTLDGTNSTGFLGINAKAADSDQLDGLDSSSFVAGVHTVTGSSVDIHVPEGNTATANCPAGERALGGGYSETIINSSGAPFDPQPAIRGFFLVSIGPNAAGTGWRVQATNSLEDALAPEDYFTVRITATAVCAKAS